MDIKETLNGIIDFYYTNKTRCVDFRIDQLKKLKEAIIKYEPEFVRALYHDLHKCEAEVYMTETRSAIKEIDFIIRHLRKWARPEKVPTPMLLKPSKSLIVKDPYGVVLIIVPFNYPVQLSLVPLAGAIAAGNCAVLRYSKRTPETSKILHRMISEIFNPNYIKSFLPEGISSEEILKGNFDYIFFTGSSATGREVAKAGAERLIPYTLELGGKSPVIVDSTADIQTAARRIVWGKFMNAGQTCIAPDYLMAHFSIKEQLIDEIIKAIRKFYGVNVQESPDYGRIVDENGFYRLREILQKENDKIIHGGQTDECGLYIEPTLIKEESFDAPSMQEEIFGPILPIFDWSDINDVFNNIRIRPKPLAFYVFSKDKEFAKMVMKSFAFGGGAVNDTINHTASVFLPFGGVGHSGIGKYHGKYTFDTFTHLKSILIRNNGMFADKIFPPYDQEKIDLINKF